MNKIFLCFVIFSFVCSCFAQNEYNIKNKNLSLSFLETKNNMVISGFENLETGQEFIVKPKTDDTLWTLEARVGKDNETKLELKPNDCEKLTIQKSVGRIHMIWTNVKKEPMDKGFDVQAFVTLKGCDSLWNLKIKNNSDKYVITSVKYPNITNIDARKPAKVTYPLYGGLFDEDFKGYFEYHYPSIWYPMQWTFVTKGNTTLYMAAEDPKAKDKYFSAGDCGEGKMVFYVRNTPLYMEEKGHDYEQEYNFCMSAIKGDWYDAAKKYRKWGIKSNFTPFSKGLLATRKDIPQWYKELPVWIRSEGVDQGKAQKVIDFAKYLDVPVATHVYYWSKYAFDTHYPNILPASDDFVRDIKAYKDAGIKVMPYTNGRLTDIALSPFALEKGKDLLVLDEKGEGSPEVWEHAKKLGADNYVICPYSQYADFQINEFGNIAKELGVDSLYIDEVCAASGFPCFNPAHNHPKGGGENWVKGYNIMLDKIRENMNKYTKEPVVLTSECANECFAFDGWLRCNEADPSIADSPVSNVIYSGYVSSFGFYYDPNEFNKDEALPAINKTAIMFSKGYQLGWGIGWVDLEKYPKFAKYIKNAAQARYKAYKFFNLGEMVRNVKFTSPIPKRKIFFQNFALESNNEYPCVRTCSFNYKEKACVMFTNVTENTISFTWESKGEDLGLKRKSNYKINEFYPNEKNVSNKNLGGKITIEPFETKLYIVE